MNPAEGAAVRDACAGNIRTLHDAADALAAASVAIKMVSEALEGIERDLIAFASLVSED